MLWTEDDAFLAKLEQMPKMYMSHTANERIRMRIREEEAKIEYRNRRIKRIRIMTTVGLPLIIILLITSFLVTDSGRDFARNAWVRLQGNVVQLEDGVVAEFRDHKVTMAEVEEERQYVLGSTEDILLRRLKNLMVYEEALTKGFAPNPNLSESEAQYTVMMQYFDYIIGKPNVMGGEYKKAVSHYLDISFERYKSEVLFNKQYEDQFNWKRIIDQGGNTAILPDYVLASFRGVQLLTKYTPDFFPDKMTVDQVRNKLAYEFLYQEAVAKGHATSKKPNENYLKLKERYDVDPVFRESIQKEMSEKNLKETDYWEQLRQMEQRETTIKKYIRILYPDTINMEEEDYQKVVALIGEERLQQHKEEIVINERFASQYNWIAAEITTIPEDEMPTYVIAQYRDHQVLTFDHEYITYRGEKKRFSRSKADSALSTWIAAEIAKQKGYTPISEDVDVMLDALKMRLMAKQSAIDEYVRKTGLTEEELWDHIRELLEASSLALQWLIEQYPPIEGETGIRIIEPRQLKEIHKKYWDEVQYNPKYPFIEDL